MKIWRPRFERQAKIPKPMGLHEQLVGLRSSVEMELTEPGRLAYWTSRWEPEVRLSSARIESNRNQFYWLRGIAAVTSVVVPALVGLNLSGMGGVWVRWITFGLSLVAGTSVAMLALFRFNDRWFLYRNLCDELLRAAWSFAIDSRRDDAWANFVRTTEGAIAKYNASYETEVIISAQRDGEKNGVGGEDKHK